MFSSTFKGSAKKEHDLYKVITVCVIFVVHDIELRFLNTHHCHFSVPPVSENSLYNLIITLERVTN